MRLAEVHKLEGHSDRVWNLAWSPCGKFLASSSGDKTVKIWVHDGVNWVCKNTLDDSHSKTVRTTDWSPSGNFLATASFDMTTGIWEKSGEEFEFLASLEGHENEVKCAKWHPSGSFLATCGRDKTVWVWEALPGAEFDCISVLTGHSQDVKSVCWHPSKEILVSASYDNSIKIWTEDENGDDWQCSQTLTGPISGHSSTVWEVSFNSDGDKMVSCSDDLTLKIWDTKNDPQEATGGDKSGWSLQNTISGYHERTIFSVDWSRVNGLIATGSGDNSVQIFSADSEAEIESRENISQWVRVVHSEKAHESDVNCVRWHPKEGNTLASAGDDGVIKIWSVLDM